MQDHALPASAEADAVTQASQCLEIARRAAAVDSPAALQAWWQAVAARWWPGASLVTWPLDAAGPAGPAHWLHAEGAHAPSPWSVPGDGAAAHALATRLHRAWLAAGCQPCEVALAPAPSTGSFNGPALAHGLRGRRLHAVLAPASPARWPLELLAPLLDVACGGAGLAARERRDAHPAHDVHEAQDLPGAVDARADSTLPPRPALARAPSLQAIQPGVPGATTTTGAWPAPASGPITVARAPGGALSLRERQIMAWVAQGKTNPEIGCILRISEFTVKNHLKSIFSKLDVTNRAQAVARLSRIAFQA